MLSEVDNELLFHFKTCIVSNKTIEQKQNKKQSRTHI